MSSDQYLSTHSNKHHKKHHKKDKKSYRKIVREESSSPEVFKYKNDKEKSDCYDSRGYKVGSKEIKEVFGYTDDNNPFMDTSLSSQLMWGKNNDKKRPRTKEQIERELESVQKRQREHDQQREERLRDQELLQRAKEAQTYLGRKSDSHFDIEQAKNRSKIRINEGRAKPIDLLIQYVNEEDEHNDAINHEPTELLIGRDREDLEDLLVDIDAYSRNMEPGKNTQYWEDVRLVVEDELKKLDRNNGRTNNVSEESIKEITKFCLDDTLEKAIEWLTLAHGILETGDQKHVDRSYFEFFCKFGAVLVAKRRLQERHRQNLQSKLNKLKQEQGICIKPLFPSVCVENSEIEKCNQKIKNDCIAEREFYDHDIYSPILRSDEDVIEEAIDHVIYAADDDVKKLEFMRAKFLKSGTHDLNKDDELMKRMREGEEKGDEEFTEQILVEDQSFLWSDKYRPRKPRFLNRVNTGFDWNKYNQTHYDIDNPPPKIVQGYKFNILYPDLIDKTKTPIFELVPCTDDDNYATITFKAGPPYEDIAFKIVNREWETSERHGYKCQFYRDMLQLHFHFKRYRYRK